MVKERDEEIAALNVKVNSMEKAYEAVLRVIIVTIVMNKKRITMVTLKFVMIIITRRRRRRDEQFFDVCVCVCVCVCGKVDGMNLKC